MQGVKQLADEVLNLKEQVLVKWVCDYQRASALNKALRNLKPTKVQIIANPEYLEVLENAKLNPGNHSVNYAVAMSKFKMYEISNDNVTDKEVNFFGNHALDYGVHYFDTEQECVEQYNALIYKHIVLFEEEKAKVNKRFDTTINKLQNMFIDSDYVIEKLSRG